MIDMVELTIKTEEESLLHKWRAQLLPVAFTIMTSLLRAAHMALNEGLASCSNTNQTNSMPNDVPQLTPLLGEDRLDAIIARLSDSFLAKLNDIAVAASNSSSKIDQLASALDLRLSRLEGKTPATDALAAKGGGFITARQAAIIHACAINNITDHDLSQPNAQQHNQENDTPWPYEPSEDEPEYMDPDDPAMLALDCMTEEQILEDIRQIPIPPEYHAPAAPAAPSTTQPPSTHQPTATMATPHPATTSTNNQAPPKLNYVAAAASSGWKQVQSWKGKGKANKQTQNARTASQNTTATTNNPLPKPQNN